VVRGGRGDCPRVRHERLFASRSAKDILDAGRTEHALGPELDGCGRCLSDARFHLRCERPEAKRKLTQQQQRLALLAPLRAPFQAPLLAPLLASLGSEFLCSTHSDLLCARAKLPEERAKLLSPAFARFQNIQG
jgi:hypothetical protein